MEEPAAFGLKLKAFRAANNISQSDVATIIFTGKASGPRIIGNIEAGTRPIKPIELSKLKASDLFADFDNFKIEESNQTKGAVFPLREAFAQEQQNFLGKEINRQTYEIWLINADALPMLMSRDIRETWVTNIHNGINYSVMWDISMICRSPTSEERFKEFLTIAKSIISDVSVLRREESEARRGSPPHTNNSPGIDVYGYYFGNDPKNEKDQEGRQLYNTLTEDLDLKSTNGLRIYPAFNTLDLAPGCWRLPIDCYFVNATTVIYLPVPQKRFASTFTVLEPLEVIEGFDSSDPLESHIFLGKKASAEMAAIIRAFKEWFSKNRK